MVSTYAVAVELDVADEASIAIWGWRSRRKVVYGLVILRRTKVTGTGLASYALR
jgi:hypothetical protein